MNVIFSIAICFLPLVILITVCRIHGIKLGKLYIGALLGLIAVLPIIIAQLFVGKLPFFNIHSFSSALFRALVLNGVIEETWKSAVLLILPAKKMSLRDFFACSLVAGLSLGCFESASYFLKYLQMANHARATLLYSQIFMRIISADLIHLFCTGLGGIFIWAAKNRKQQIIALVFAILAHGIYDFFAMYTSNIRFFAIAAVLFAIVECRVRYMKLLPKTQATPQQTNN